MAATTAWRSETGRCGKRDVTPADIALLLLLLFLSSLPLMLMLLMLMLLLLVMPSPALLHTPLSGTVLYVTSDSQPLLMGKTS
jgi:hypothetical protein